MNDPSTYQDMRMRIETLESDVKRLSRQRNAQQHQRQKLERLLEKRTRQLKNVSDKLRNVMKSYIEMQKHLQEIEQKLNAVFNQTYQFMGMLSPEGTIITANQTALDAIGAVESDIIGKPFWDTPWWNHSTDLQLQLKDAIAKASDGQFVRFESVHPSSDGQFHIFDFSLKPVKNSDGAVVYLLPEGRDITDRIRMEDELKKAKEAAEAADFSKSAFLANMSHEIRTPMNGVIAAAELAMSENLPPKVNHYLQIIHTSAVSLLGIINDILDFSKIETGGLVIDSKPFWLDEVFERVTAVFISKAVEKQIEFLIDIDPDTPKALIGDPLRLQQILNNLVSNSLKFTPKGGLIQVGAILSDISGDRVSVSFFVKDTGIGITLEDQRTLFKPFTQADISITRKYEGTGLGLSICKHLVDLMNGTMKVDSLPGRGSTFSFTVYFDLQPDAGDSRLMVPDDMTGRNVLIVDDSPHSRGIISNFLKSFGFNVNSAPSGTDSIKLLGSFQGKEDPFILILMDLIMPGMNGIETVGKIRKELKLQTPVLLMTSHGFETDTIDASSAGIDRVLVKPLSPSMLFNTIMDIFGRHTFKYPVSEPAVTTQFLRFKQQLKGTRVVVADADTTHQEIIRALLENAHIHVIMASTGTEAARAVKDHDVNAVLMDPQVPQMDAFNSLRSDSDWPHIPVIAMTDAPLNGTSDYCLQSGMDACISKPIHPNRLFRVLSEAIEKIGNLPGIELAGLRSEELEPSSVAATVPQRILPTTLPEIDIQTALTTLNIDEDIFKKILIGFYHSQQETEDRIKRFTDQNDWKSIHHIAHSLKGSAANICAGQLRDAAYALESATLNPTSPPSTGLVETLLINLNRVMASLKQLSDTTGVITDSQEPCKAESTQLKTELKQLADALQRYDPIDVNRLLKSIEPFLDRRNRQTLEKQIREYEYAEALSCILKIMNS